MENKKILEILIKAKETYLTKPVTMDGRLSRGLCCPLKMAIMGKEKFALEDFHYSNVHVHVDEEIPEFHEICTKHQGDISNLYYWSKDYDNPLTKRTLHDPRVSVLNDLIAIYEARI